MLSGAAVPLEYESVTSEEVSGSEIGLRQKQQKNKKEKQ